MVEGVRVRAIPTRVRVVPWGANKISDSQLAVVHAEAEAVRWGLLLAKDAGFRVLDVESDNAHSISMLKGNQENFTELGTIIDDIKFICRDFSSIVWSHVNRVCNKVAHMVASLTNSTTDRVWIENVPNKCSELLLFDAISGC
ncbi:conserved hypothetical protein [Ricinus communis]|uniref:RNase H type-1 domain-containing protein n=1 Tax=Ricinus communis TaxID=3988 RepID=B9T5J0_RICCO|nr:conserved hypothetical protein [Ricinus communis]